MYKIKLSVIFLLIGLTCKGQVNSTTLDSLVRGWNAHQKYPPVRMPDIGSGAYTLLAESVSFEVLDTIPCIMLCADTASYLVYSLYEDQVDSLIIKPSYIKTWSDKLFCVRGYEVLQINNRCVVYLDANRKPLNYFVWMSKEFKP